MNEQQATPKKAEEYSLIVNKQRKTWAERRITGADIKKLVGSPSEYVVNQLVSGPGEDPEIGDTQAVDLDHQAEPNGEKKFTTRKPTTSPGRPRFLPMEDRDFLDRKQIDYDEIEEKLPDGTERKLVIFNNFECLGQNFTRDASDQLVRQQSCRVLILVPNGYATTKLDSFYTQPRLLRADGSAPQAATGGAQFVGSDWQFWSRHLDDADWRVGMDGMETYLQYVRNEVKRA